MTRRIKILVADDSAFMRRALSAMLEAQSDMSVVGTARNGEEAVAKTLALQPDVVTMDVTMPGVDGLEAVRRIVAQAHVPIIMVSAHTKSGTETTFRALELGAVDFVAKPDSAYANIEDVSRDLVEKVRGCAGRAHPAAAPRRAPQRLHGGRAERAASYGCVAIGASTGGPVALSNVIPSLPKAFPAAVVVVQHMPVGFTLALARRLDALSQIEVVEGGEGAALVPGRATIAPAGKQIALRRNAGGVTLHLCDDADALHVPSVDALASEVSKIYGSAGLAVILTGMGRDGTAGLRRLKAAGGYVVGQDEATCVVYGMPRAAALAGLVDRVAPLSEIAEILCGLCST
ncbi:MAG: protein-glutamate methylesterase/protein-glutamine glutaminase [Candidatus Tyrphobacter sp.]